MQYDSFYRLLRIACGREESFPKITDEEWRFVYEESSRQMLLGVIYQALCKLPAGLRPSMKMMLQWAGGAESIKGLNKLLNSEAARYTQLFSEAGRRSVILKGQANARLYPDPFSRQPGDIDIWMEGGRKSVLQLLEKMGLWRNEPVSPHHAHLSKNADGVMVEVHFIPSSGNYNPLSNRRLQKYLSDNLENLEFAPEGFYVPSIRFALAMQLSHIQRHFLGYGVGLRQLMDYYFLLKKSTGDDREEIAAHLKSLGLAHIAGAVMWILQTVFGLERERMLCEPDEYRGQWLLKAVMNGGNFGRYGIKDKRTFVTKWLEDRIFVFCRLRFDFWEVFWNFLRYWPAFVGTIPSRVKKRRFALRKMPK